MVKNLIIFGAGASITSNYDSPVLVNKLFDTLKSLDHVWDEIPEEFIAIFQNDFEKGMNELWDNNSPLLPILNRAMALYFSNFYPSPECLYRKLASKLSQNWKGAFVTLNYDRLLEISLLEKGLSLSILKHEDTSKIEVCYPHGCCNFFNDSVRGSAKGVSFSPRGVTTNGKLVFVTDKGEIQNRIRNEAFGPMMSYFLPDKPSPSGKNIIDQEREIFNELVTNAENIVIVGIRVRPHDKHIWDQLAKSSAKILYCSGTDSGIKFEYWSKDNSRNDKVMYSYWQENFDSICNFIEIN